MAFEDLIELVEPLILPIRGKRYQIPAVSLEDGITLRSVLDGKPDDTVTDDTVRRILLGNVLEEMTADNVPQEWIGRVMLTALSDFLHGRFTAELMWKTGGDPKEIEKLTEQIAPTNRETRRKASKRSKASTSTAAGNTTQRPASTSGTKTSRKS